MSSNKKILFLAIVLLIVPFVNAYDFNLYAYSSPEDLCPGSTELFTDVITNTGENVLAITLSASGTASSFATSVPQGVTLFPGQSKTIFTYVSPRSNTNIGTYTFNLRANSNGDSTELAHNVIVKDCYEYVIEALNSQKHICPCETDKFEFRITNNGQFTESYNLDLEGEYASSVVLSTNQVTLNAGESEILFAYVSSSCNDLGEYDFSLKASPINSNNIQTTTSTMIVDPCYDFDIETNKDLVNMCEHTQESVSITIKNTGSTANKFNLDLNGPAWANLEKNTLQVAPNSQDTLNLVLNPDYNVEGSFELDFSAEPERGEVIAYNSFNVNVKKCHGVSVDIEKSLDKICNSLENTYAVIIRNTGEYSKDYYFNVDGPDWATLDKTSATLGVGQEEQLTLTINPPYNSPSADYYITIKATAKDSDKIVSSDNIEVKTVSKDECYQATLGIDETNVEVYYDSSATVPIVLENKGTYATTYDLSVSGTASNFVYLNPSSVTIDAGKSELVYLYVAPSGQIANGDYSVTVSARLGDSSVLASEKVNIVVSESRYLVPEEMEIEEEKGESFFSKITGFITGLFKSDKAEEEVLDEIDGILDDLDEEIPEDLNETTEEIPEELNETTETLVELDLVNTLLSEGDLEEFIIGEETHTIELTTAEEEGVWITVSSDPISVNLEEGESQKLDLDNDEVYDLLVTFNGYDEGGNADVTYKKISEPIGVVEEPSEELDETEEIIEDSNLDGITGDVIIETEGESFFSEFFASFAGIFSTLNAMKFNILGLLILILIVYYVFKTGAYKKIVEFFEEEIEEEEVPVLESKEEKPKTEKKDPAKKTATKKTTKKEEEPKVEEKSDEDKEDEIEIEGLDEDEVDEESDKEDFIIEFDDDEEDKKTKK